MVFSYKAADKNGKLVTGIHSATDRAQVIAYLKAQKMTPISIGQGRSGNLADSLPKKKPKAKDMSIFCEQFCSLLRAGVPVLESLRMLGEQTKSAALKEGILNTANSVNEGNALADSMSKNEKVFDATLCSLVRAGEASGSLDTSLERMGEQYKRDAEIQAEIKKAMIYPICVVVVAIIVLAIMLIVVVPSFMSMFDEIGMEMPGITLAVMAASKWLQSNYLLALLVLVCIIVGIISFAKSKKGKRWISIVSLKIPGIKEFVIKSHASKIARTMSTLLTAGMTAIEALEILESTVSNYCYKEAIREVKEDVLVGQPMSKKFKENTILFPSMLSHMISVGEDTGDITAMLSRTADYYDKEVRTATQMLMSMVQPALILILAGIVGVVLAAVLSPMVAMYTQLGDAL